MTASAALTVQAQLCFQAESVGQPALAAVTRQWFTDGAPALAPHLWTGLSTRDTEPGDTGSRWAGAPGEVWAECAVRFGWQQDWGGFTGQRFDELLKGIDGPSTVVAFTAYELAGLGQRCYPGFPRLSLTGRYVDPRSAGWWGVKAQVSAGLVEDAALLAFVRGAADACPPSYGEIGYDNASHIDHVTSLEHGLGLRPWTSVRQSARRLRGYGWLTIVGPKIGDRLGGLDALRGSGAWHSVERLAGGGYWLLATPRLAEYGPEQATAVQAVLAPALPPGRPRADRDGEAPHRLALVGSGAMALAGRAPAPRYRPVGDEEAYLNRIDARDSSEFHIAVALRMASLHRRFPDALIWGSTRHEDGPHLICWPADGDEVFVWRVVPDDDPFAGMDLLPDLRPDLAAAAEDPLSRGRRVIPGPPFVELGLSYVEGSALTSDGGEVGIYDAGSGRQLCYSDGEAETKAAYRVAEVMADATALKRAVAAART